MYYEYGMGHDGYYMGPTGMNIHTAQFTLRAGAECVCTQE